MFLICRQNLKIFQFAFGINMLNFLNLHLFCVSVQKLLNHQPARVDYPMVSHRGWRQLAAIGQLTWNVSFNISSYEKLINQGLSFCQPETLNVVTFELLNLMGFPSIEPAHGWGIQIETVSGTIDDLDGQQKFNLVIQ